jgi:mannosyltransferase
MKVTLDCIIFGLQRFGGISTYWHGLVDYLSNSPDVELILRLPRTVRSDGGSSRAAVSSALVRVDAFSPRVSRYLPLSVRDPTDLYHSSYYRNPTSPRTPCIVTVHDFIYEKFRGGAARFVHSLQKVSAIRRADGVICISENTRRDLLEHVGNVDPARIAVIPLAAAAEQFHPLEHGAVDKSLSDVVLFVGQRVGYKRFDLAIEALRLTSDLRLGIVGAPLSREEITLLNKALRKRWIDFGPVSSGRLRLLYGSCFALLYPSSYEGFGLPVLEAMACGAPVVAANRSSLPEVGGTAALYADDQVAEAYAAKLRSLLASGFRESKIREGLERAQTFSWKNTFDRTLDFYKVVHRQRSGRA